jgi:S1/P1 Nuclease
VTVRTLWSSVCAALLCLSCGPASAWGDEGHEVIGLIAEHYLQPDVRTRVLELLRHDDSGLVERDMAHEATWADKFRDSDRDTSKRRYLGTRDWHFVDLEIDGLDIARACYGRHPLAAGVPASAGPAEACIIDKIDQFYVELGSPQTAEEERRVALQFLLHLVGDLHQPLHASDDHDQGGNRKLASGPNIGSNNLHHDWDTEFVARLGQSDSDIPRALIARITAADCAGWSSGTPLDWAVETYAVSKKHSYGLLPAASAGAALPGDASPGDASHGAQYLLSQAYVDDATAVTAEQLSKAGVRLAFLLNRALGQIKGAH